MKNNTIFNICCTRLVRDLVTVSLPLRITDEAVNSFSKAKTLRSSLLVSTNADGPFFLALAVSILNFDNLALRETSEDEGSLDLEQVIRQTSSMRAPKPKRRKMSLGRRLDIGISACGMNIFIE